MRVRFTSTVLGLRNVRSAISRLVRPSMASRAIVSSVGVRPAVRRNGIRASSAGPAWPRSRVPYRKRLERLVNALRARAFSLPATVDLARHEIRPGALERHGKARQKATWLCRRDATALIEAALCREDTARHAGGRGPRPLPGGVSASSPKRASTSTASARSPAPTRASIRSLAWAQSRGSRMPASRLARSSTAQVGRRVREPAAGDGHDTEGEPGRRLVQADARVGLGQRHDARRRRPRPRRAGPASRAPPRGSPPPKDYRPGPGLLGAFDRLPGQVGRGLRSAPP